MYGVVQEVLGQLGAEGVQCFLLFGSALGARRHFGLLPFANEKDVDLAVFATDTALVEGALSALGLEWHATRFGYHIETGTRFYIDLWLFAHDAEPTSDGYHVRCVGHGDGGCSQWYQEIQRSLPPAFPVERFFPPVQAPFGPYLMPIPAQSSRYLADTYGANWRAKCSGGGSLSLGLDCSDYYATTPFVFASEQPGGAQLLELKVGDTTRRQFRVSAGGVYTEVL